MRVLDLFAGLKGWSDPFKERGHEVFTVELNPAQEPDLVADVSKLTLDDLPWLPDIILASPPCQRFSVATIGRNWNAEDKSPKTPEAAEAIELVAATLRFIENVRSAGGGHYWLMENPRAMLRKMSLMAPYPRTTVTYCQYGERTMKPTDLWGYWPAGFQPRACQGRYAPDDCHERAPRGSKTGVQGIKGAAARGKIPRQLALEVCIAAEDAIG